MDYLSGLNITTRVLKIRRGRQKRRVGWRCHHRKALRVEERVMSQGMWVASGSQGNKFSTEVSRENAANTLIIDFWPLEL